jgi:hypothetical protein
MVRPTTARRNRAGHCPRNGLTDGGEKIQKFKLNEQLSHPATQTFRSLLIKSLTVLTERRLARTVASNRPLV